MEASHKSAPPSVKRWQLDGTDHGPPHLRSEAILSSWTPLNHKQSNKKDSATDKLDAWRRDTSEDIDEGDWNQLFEERVNLVLHWFDLWTDGQRKHLLHSLLTRSTKSQLKYCRDLLTGTVPVTRADFTLLLPRFLTLYVMSHLSPLDLCRAAQVSWQWRVLAEQDCLWIGRCVRRGWFLPYTPRAKEFGAWKNHYVTCVSSMDLPPPREAWIPYGGLDQQSRRLTEEEEEERRTERRIREKTREKLQEKKRLALRSRGPWGSNPKANGARGGSKQTERTGSGIAFGSLPSLSWPPRTTGSSVLCLSLDREPAQGLDSVQASSVSRFSQPDRALCCDYPPPALLMLLSNKIPAYELVLSGLKAGVIAVLYDCRGTLSALLSRVERATLGKQIRRIGLLAPGGTEEIQLLNGQVLSESTVLTPDHREFWEKLAGRVAPTEEGGGMDIFCPLAASASGVTLIRALSALTGLEVRAPVGLATGSFQSILGEWSDAGVCAGFSERQQQGGPAGAPARLYVWDAALQGWCRQARWLGEALGELRRSLEPRLWTASLQARGRALGFFLWERICLDKLYVSKELSDALTEGLTALCGQEEETRPVEFLAAFLMRWSQNKEEGDDNEPQNAAGEEASSAKLISGLYGSVPELPQTALDWRGEVVRELHKSERDYLGRLSALLKVYHEPIKAALDSNRAILSYADIQIIFSPVAQILNLNRTFEADLVTRLGRWSADQCVGDVFVKLSSKLRVYSNYLNNYATALKTVDKCRDTKPKFRAFLKMADRTLATQMLSLQELLLCPAWRIQEYVTLLQALSLHTHPHHPDRAHLRSALDTMLQFRRFIQKLKSSSEADRLIEETQQQIQGCPSLREGNRQLITTQDVELLRSPDEQVPDCLRTYERVSDVGLFLFSDALVVTLKNTRHTPFTISHRSAHTFLASVALTSLTVREIVHSQYVRHAFVLEGPFRSWACSTERGEDKAEFLSALRAAISSALTEHE